MTYSSFALRSITARSPAKNTNFNSPLSMTKSLPSTVPTSSRSWLNQVAEVKFHWSPLLYPYCLQEKSVHAKILMRPSPIRAIRLASLGLHAIYNSFVTARNNNLPSPTHLSHVSSVANIISSCGALELSLVALEGVQHPVGLSSHAENIFRVKSERYCCEFIGVDFFICR